MTAHARLAAGEALIPGGGVAHIECPETAHPTHSGERGFSLVELMVVVVIIAVLAVIAVPAMGAQLRNRWTEQAAQEVTLLYRTARMRSMSRGSAVLFTYDSGAPDGTAQVRVREAVRGGANPNCAWLPISNCFLADFTLAPEIRSFDPRGRKRYGDIGLTARQSPNTDLTTFDVCFSPLGRTYLRSTPTGPFSPFAGVITVSVVQREHGTLTPFGLTRRAMLLSNGTARMGVSQ